MIIRNNKCVSVIIPVYNGDKYLSEAIGSVLAQTYRPIELIIVDDGSTDNSAQIAQSYKGIRYIYQHNKGVTEARNVGILSSQGDFIAFLDQDDLWTTNKLSVQIAYLHKYPEVGYVLAGQKFFLEPGAIAPPWLKKELLLHDQIGYLPGTFVVRRRVFNRIGLFDPTYKIGSDTDWLARAKDLKVPMAILPEVLLIRRIHHSNQSAQTDIIHAELTKILKASIDRRRNTKSMPEVEG